MNTKTIVIIIAVIVVVLVGWYFLGSTAGTTQAPTQNSAQNSTQTPGASQPSVSGVTVTYTNSGFSPATVTVKQGQSVTWIDQRSNNMWIASNPHPVHSGYDGTTRDQHCAAGYTGATPFDECSGGTTFTFTFTFGKTGTWGYHDHMDHGMTGTVVVTQ